jgi:hypothetical protein
VCLSCLDHLKALSEGEERVCIVGFTGAVRKGGLRKARVVDAIRAFGDANTMTLPVYMGVKNIGEGLDPTLSRPVGKGMVVCGREAGRFASNGGNYVSSSRSQ